MDGKPLFREHYHKFRLPGIRGRADTVTGAKSLTMPKPIIFIIVSMLLVRAASAQSRPLSVGDTIPSFSLRDQDGKIFQYRDHVGKNIMVIYFYPKDESAVCTKEACAFRDNYLGFTKAGALVIGINSADSASHKSFQQHHQLPFILLSDPHNEVLKLFGVKGKFLFTGRETFVVDLSGKIVYTYNSFTHGPDHAGKTLQFIQDMKKN